MTKIRKFQLVPLQEAEKYAIERYNEVKKEYERIGGSIKGLDNALVWENDLNEKYEEECNYLGHINDYEADV